RRREYRCPPRDRDRPHRWNRRRRPLRLALGARRDRSPRRPALARPPQRGAVGRAPEGPYRRRPLLELGVAARPRRREAPADQEDTRPLRTAEPSARAEA